MRKNEKKDKSNKTPIKIGKATKTATDKKVKKLQKAGKKLRISSEELKGQNLDLKNKKKAQQDINEMLVNMNEELIILNEQLEHAKNYAESIIATIHEPLIVLDENLRVKTANDAFYKTFQVNKGETEGVLIYHLGNKQWNIPDLKTLLEEILPEKTKFNNFNVTHTFPNIGERIMVLNAREIKRQRSDEKLILLAIQDMTETLRTEALLKHERELKTEALEQAILERTFELKNSNKALEISNIELASFNNLVSHDLQEPIRKIQILTDLILQKEFEDLSRDAKDLFRKVLKDTKHMQALIVSLLAYSHSNIPERKLKRTNLAKIIAEVKKEFSEQIKEKKAVIKVLNLGEAYVSPTQFKLVIYHLLSNAIKFSKPDVLPLITIKGKIGEGRHFHNNKLSKTKLYLHISIIDNGIGFDPKYQEQIFKVFKRLHTRDKYEGTGIGLAICKRIVENHNGIITANGATGKGTTVDIYLPTM